MLKRAVLTPFGRICSKQAQNRVKTACFEAKKGSFSPVYVRGSEQDLSRMGRFGVQKGSKSTLLEVQTSSDLLT